MQLKVLPPGSQAFIFMTMMNFIEIITGTLEDIPLLVSHHRLMFEDIYEKEGLEINKQKFDLMDQIYGDKLKSQIQTGECQAWIAVTGGKKVASGTITLATLVPTPDDSNSVLAFIHSIFTESTYRRQGCSRIILKSIIDHCRLVGVRRLLLSTSEMAQPLYLSLGFKKSTNSMALVIPE